jgi:hypothetical protein
MNTSQKKVGIGFWLVWALASAIGFGVGAVLGIGMSLGFVPEGVAFPIFIGAIFGAIGALAQWMVIRRRVPEVDLWVPFSALAFLLAIATTGGMFSRVSTAFNPFFILAGVYGLLGGFLQGLILQKQGVPIGWWIAASILGGLLGSMVTGSVVAAVSTNEAWQVGTTTFFLIWFRLGAPIGLGLGITTGAALVWFLRYPKIESKGEAAMQGTR